MMTLPRALRPLLFAAAMMPLLLPAPAAAQPMGLDELQSLQGSSKKDAAINDGAPNMRLQAMSEAALTLGIQHGYIAMFDLMRETLRKNADIMDRAWDFSVLMKLASDGMDEQYLLPPVAEHVKEVVSISDDHNRLRTVGEYFRISKPERLVTSPPNWREYLLMGRGYKAGQPAESLLPTNPFERALWRDQVKKGWEAGTRQAAREMINRVRELGSDFIGIARYMRLVQEGKIVTTDIASSHQPVSGGGQELRINQRLYSIGTPASFTTDTSKWKALQLDTRDGYRLPDEQR